MKNKNILKTILFTLFLTITFSYINAQIPETFNYQGVARTEEGTPIANQDVVLEVSILQGTNCDDGGGCNVVWQEIHEPTTNEFGLFTIEIGGGQNTFAGSETNFVDINWHTVGLGNYFLKVRVDFGNTDYVNGMVDMGTIKFQAVPYSLVAEDVARVDGKLPFALTELSDVNISNTVPNNHVLKWDATAEEWINGLGSGNGVTTLMELEDIDFSSLGSSNVVYFDGDNWLTQQLNYTDLSGSLNLGDLGDVGDLSSAVVDEVLTWNGSQWISQEVGGGSSVWTEFADYVYYTGSSNEGMYVEGTYDGSNIPNLGAGTRLIFFPGNASFRAGVVDGTQWDNMQVGDYSTAFGANTIASGDYSVAMGENCSATNRGAFAMGNDCIASGGRSVAFGNNNIANSTNAAAFGNGNTAGSPNCLVAGANNAATNADYSVVVGQNNSTYATHAFVYGDGCEASANGLCGLSGGYMTEAAGNYTVAFGVGTIGQSYAGVYIGRFNTTGGDNLNWVANDPLFVAGNGADAGSPHNAMVLYKDGNLEIDAFLTEDMAKTSKNTQPLNNLLDKLLLINGLTYYNEVRGINQYGLAADNVELVFPELIFDNSNGGKSISYTRFTPILIEAIKEQQLIINDLKAENLELKQKYEDLNKRLEKIENQ